MDKFFEIFKYFPLNIALPATIILILTVWSFLSDLRKYHILIRWIIFIIFFMSFIPYGYYEYINPSKIYLKFKQNQKWIPLVKKYTPINRDIKKDEEIGLRFVLRQDNIKRPEIKKIAIIFPATISEEDITPIPDYNDNNKENIWKRMSYSNGYFLDVSNRHFTKGLGEILPGIDVKFKETNNLNFRYIISGDNMDSIDREFTINPVDNPVQK